jgi:hypothetical protein
LALAGVERRRISSSRFAVHDGRYFWQAEPDFSFIFPEVFMSRLVPLAVFALFLGLNAAATPAARAVNCSLSACMAQCTKMHGATPGFGCNSWCAQTMEERKAKGQCKK